MREPSDPACGVFGAVCASNQMAAATGMAMLERGGNAFDAAAAAAFTIQVVEPDQNGPGGEVAALFHAAATGKVAVLCGQGVAPQDATAHKFKQLGLSNIPSKGLLPAVTPGNLDAWLLLLRDFGTLPLAIVLQPAIDYALGGFPIARRTVAHIEKFKSRFTNAWTSTAEVFLPGGQAPKPQQLVRNEALGRTLLRILSESQSSGADRQSRIEAARQVCATGFVADAIDEFCRTPAVYDFKSMDAHSGFLRGSDIAMWRASIEEPAMVDYHRWTLCKAGPWSQGPVMLQHLALLTEVEGRAIETGTAEFVHHVVEAAKLAYADRGAYYGDPKFAFVPLTELLSAEYSLRRRRLITAEASSDVVCGESTLVPEAASRFRDRIGSVARKRGEMSTLVGAEKCTVHIDAVDRWGNMIAATQSGGWIDDSPVIPSLGFPLSTRGQMFNLSESSPNCVAPGKRPLTTLSPSLALRDGEPHLAFGTPGADQQDQWSVAFFLRYQSGMGLASANAAPLFHTRHLLSSFSPPRIEPRSVLAEETLMAEVVDDLRGRGHAVTVVESFTGTMGILNFGTMSAIARQGKHLSATASHRWPYSFAYVR